MSQASSTQPLDPQAQIRLLQERVAQLEQSQAEGEGFAASVAHELRTPLSAADSFCSLLAQSLAELPGDQARECLPYAERIRRGFRHMDELIDALLALARASRTALKLESVDLSALAREVLDDLQSRQPQRASDFHVQPGLVAQGDKALLRQVLANLLGNAWKFSARRERVYIEFGREGAVFHVRDQGAGFDMDQAPRLFQPFERLHSASEFPGTGIGLATARRIIARHGGQLSAQSSPEQGATFFFTLGAPEPQALPPTP